MTKGEKAKALFKEGYNCSQAVVLAFAEELGIDEKILARAAAGFGGGMGRLREVCGSVSGAVMVIGLLTGSGDVGNSEAKKELYGRVQEQASAFKETNGSYICRELLQGVTSDTRPQPDDRTPEYYRKRPCAELVELSADICESILQKYNITR